MALIPNIVVQKLASSNAFDGTAPDIVAVERHRGRMLYYGSTATSGGLIVAPSNVGHMLHSLLVKAPGADGGSSPHVQVALVDTLESPDEEIVVHDETDSPAAFFYNPEKPLIVPPDWSITVKTLDGATENVLTGVGTLIFYLSVAWIQHGLDQTTSLGAVA